MQSSLPETVVYLPGEYRILVKAGEQMDHWIAAPTDKDYTVSIFGNKKAIFVKPTKGGKTFGMSEAVEGRDVLWKFSAINDIKMRIVVK